MSLDKNQYAQNTDQYFMSLALNEARDAALHGEVPVGAVVVRAGKVISSCRNRTVAGRNALLHAETQAISEACRALGGWRLTGCELYVTLEPCMMCAGAAINARIGRIVYGAADERFGACGSMCDIPAMPSNHRPNVTAGVLGEECSEILSSFFSALRSRKARGLKVHRYSNARRDDVLALFDICPESGALIASLGLPADAPPTAALRGYPMLALLDGRVAGLAVLHRGGKIALLMVAPDRRRTGIGRLLCEACAVKSEKMGWNVCVDGSKLSSDAENYFRRIDVPVI